MKNKLMALAAAAILTGCFSQDKGTGPVGAADPARKPGQIQLVAMDGLAKGAASAGSSSYVFDLDTARSSFQQYFIIQNTGDVEITDIDLATNNPNFTFSPSHISSLAPSADASVMQVIKLNVVHGKRLDGLGYGDFLTPGLNTVTATITGATIDEENETLALNESLTLKTFAKVAKFSIIAQDTVYPLGSLNAGMTFGATFVSGGVSHYYVPIDTGLNPSHTIEIKNTGNTPLTVRRWAAGTYAPLSTLTLQADSSFSFTAQALEFDANGVTFAPSDLPVGANGKITFIMYGDW